MFTEKMIPVLASFAPLFSGSVWENAKILLLGAILCRNQRTVAAILRVMGLSNESRFVNYHRVLNRACWSARQASKILLGLMITFVPASWPLIIGIDETIERRKGKKIKAKGCYRDAVRSSEKHVIRCFGLKWLCMMLIVPLPWSQRPWALPFLTVLTPSEKANKEASKRHKTTIDWTIQMIKQVSRWVDNHSIVLVGDGSFASIRLAHACRKLEVTLISRLRLDARLFDFPQIQPGKRGPKPKKGQRLQKLKDIVDDKQQQWKHALVRWYGHTIKPIHFLTGVCLWHTPGQQPVPIRWVLVLDPDGKDKPQAFFSTDTQLDPVSMVQYFVMRWAVEVTFEETRKHLGLETQRQWAEKAITRSTPALMALFSIVTLIADRWSNRDKLMPQTTAWYQKEDVTFSDVLTFVRKHIWNQKYNKSAKNSGDYLFSTHEWQTLLDLLAAAA